MCGRTAQGLAPAQIRQQLDKTLPSKPADSWIGEDKYRTSYNVAPTRYQPIVRAEPKTNSYVVHMMRWGLIPKHTKAMPDYSSVLKSINARDDSLFAGPTGKAMFSHSKNHKRCILLAEGATNLLRLRFYEWRRRGKERVPFYTKRRDGNLMLMAAIYDVAQIQGSEESLYTYATITTNASPQLDWLHDRMPVLIPNGDHQKIRMWLDPNQTWNSALEAMLKPCDEFIEAEESSDLGTCTVAKKVYALETYQVDEKVNSVKNDSPEFAKPWNSSSNKKTLNRFFVTKAECHNIPVSHAVKQELDIDELTKGQPKAIISEWGQGQEQEPLQPETETAVIDADHIDYWEDQNEENENECRSKDEDEDDQGLKRALELSLQEQNSKDNNSILSVSNATKAPTIRNDEKTNVDPSASIDLLEKRRNELQQEEEEMKRVLELSLLQAIADGHENIDLQHDTQLPEGGEIDELTKKEQEELKRAIAASLNDSEFQHEASLSQQSTTSSTTTSTTTATTTTTMSSPGPKKQAPSVNSTPKKRKSSTGASASPGGGGGGSSKNRKSNQDAKITSFFQHANPH
ncbi:hypothetical protein BGX26_000829 [Mortierella sp. AD094]|nr:hypothetical protein BGX26_000829 [Mortierella sp. AD094]